VRAFHSYVEFGVVTVGHKPFRGDIDPPASWRQRDGILACRIRLGLRTIGPFFPSREGDRPATGFRFG